MKSNLQHSVQKGKQNTNYSQYKNNIVQNVKGFVYKGKSSIHQYFNQIWQKIQKVLTAINFSLHHITFGFFENMRLPWLKIGVVAIVAFVLLQKDLHFQIHMKAPLGGEQHAQQERAKSATEQLGLTSSLSLLDAAKASLLVSNLDSDATETYIKRFGKIAITEQQKYKIPASVKMAMAIVESEAGTSNYTKQTNNHFGQRMKDMQFNTAWENWRAHSQSVTSDQSKFKVLLRYGNDYKSWAKGLKELGYSSIKNYDELLINLIEKYEMQRMDNMDV